MLDGIALRLFGMTREKAHADGICIRCRKPVAELGFDGWDLADKAEWRISALCPPCWSAYMDGEDDAA